jgi:hypothetical protein
MSPALIAGGRRLGWQDLLQRGDEALKYFALAAARGLGNPDWRALPLREVQVG